MSGAVRFLRPRRDNDRDGRVLTCRKCGDVVRVYEIPTPKINPRAFVCGECLTDVTMRELPVPFSEQHPPRRAA